MFSKARLREVVTDWLLNQCEAARRHRSSLCDGADDLLFVFVDGVERVSDGLKLCIRVADTGMELAKSYEGVVSFRLGAPVSVLAIEGLDELDIETA